MMNKHDDQSLALISSGTRNLCEAIQRLNSGLDRYEQVLTRVEGNRLR